MEEISLKDDAEADPRAAARLAALRGEMGTLEERQRELEAKWKAEKGALEGVNKIKEAIDRMNVDIEKAEQG
jgi:ATP-dependent Clp protease ATP-binding subunit ClpB